MAVAYFLNINRFCLTDVSALIFSHSSWRRFIGKKMMEPCFNMSKMQVKSFWTGHYNTLRINLVVGQ